MRQHTMENYFWDEGQLGPVVGTLDNVDQLIIEGLYRKKWRHITEIWL